MGRVTRRMAAQKKKQHKVGDYLPEEVHGTQKAKKKETNKDRAAVEGGVDVHDLRTAKQTVRWRTSKKKAGESLRQRNGATIKQQEKNTPKEEV